MRKSATTVKATTPKPKCVVLPPKATKRFEEIFKWGGIITGVTVSYSLPCEPGLVSYGQSFLFGKEVKGIKIK